MGVHSRRQRGTASLHARHGQGDAGGPLQASTQPRRKSSAKIALILSGLLIASISILGLGAFALFTATASNNNSTSPTNDLSGKTPGPQSINTADLVLALQNTADGTNGGNGSVSVNLTDPPTNPVVPGDTIERAVNLVNQDSTGANLASITLGYSDSTSNDLLTEDSTCPSGDTNCTSGDDELTFELEACSAAWTASTSQPPTFTCSGTQSTVLGGTTAGTDAISAVLGGTPTPSLGTVAALTAGSTSYLMVELTLPTTAGNTVQSLTAGITYTFTGNQSAGTNV